MRLPLGIYVSLGILILGIISSFSTPFFNFLDTVTAKIMLPIAGLFISLFVGWYLNSSLVIAQLTNKETLKFSRFFIKTYIFLLRYVAPVAILAIFIYGLIH